ncbi:MAG: hypothetical protein R6U63_02925 [Longimicrobiales bacterium]
MLINGFKSKAAALRYLRAQGHPINALLAAPESNPKVAKNGKLDVLTAPLHLAPFDLSGYQVCPQASAGCAAACLHTAGNPAYMAGKDASRKAKTRAYFEERAAFMAVLVFEITALERKAKAKGMQAGIRLNATSDLPFERRNFAMQYGADRPSHFVNLMQWFNDVQFYDYTKVTKRALAHARGQMPANYHLTFSKNENNDADCARVIKAGGNVAVVCAPDVYKQAVETGRLPYPYDAPGAIDGDAHDYRPADPVGKIVALKAKGDARHDTSGFVVR